MEKVVSAPGGPCSQSTLEKEAAPGSPAAAQPHREHTHTQGMPDAQACVHVGGGLSPRPVPVHFGT